MNPCKHANAYRLDTEKLSCKCLDVNSPASQLITITYRTKVLAGCRNASLKCASNDTESVNCRENADPKALWCTRAMSSNMVENGIMSKVGVTLVVLLLVLDAPVFSSARVVFENWSSDTSFRRGLSESNEPRTVAVQLIHTDHVNSPYMQPNLTVLQRAQNAAKRSKERLNYFSSTILGKQQAFGVNDALSSPVSSGQGDYVMQISVGTPAR